MMDVNMPHAVCPHCEKKLNGAEHAGGQDRVPEPGDVSLCSYCYKYSEYTERFTLIPFDLDSLDNEDERKHFKNMALSLKAHMEKHRSNGIQGTGEIPA